MAEKRVYEVLFIVDTDTPEDEAARLTESLRQTVTDQGGAITRQEVLGRRNLAYRIGRKNEGVYNLFEIEGTGREIAELERRMRVMDQVIRYMTVRVDEDRQRAEKFKERRARRASKRAGAGAGASGGGAQRRGSAGEGEA